MKNKRTFLVFWSLLGIFSFVCFFGVFQETANAEETYLELLTPYPVVNKDSTATITVVDVQKVSLEKQYIKITLQFSYANEKVPSECRNFAELFTAVLFQGDISCNEIYISTKQTREHVNTYVRNGGTITFDLAFDVSDYQSPLQLVIIPSDAKSSNEYMLYDLPMLSTSIP